MTSKQKMSAIKIQNFIKPFFVLKKMNEKEQIMHHFERGNLTYLLNFKNSRENNDMITKYREKLIVKKMNTKDNVVKTLKKTFEREGLNIITLKLVAGMKNSYDFKATTIKQTIKFDINLEFKVFKTKNSKLFFGNCQLCDIWLKSFDKEMFNSFLVLWVKYLKQIKIHIKIEENVPSVEELAAPGGILSLGGDKSKLPFLQKLKEIQKNDKEGYLFINKMSRECINIFLQKIDINKFENIVKCIIIKKLKIKDYFVIYYQDKQEFEICKSEHYIKIDKVTLQKAKQTKMKLSNGKQPYIGYKIETSVGDFVCRLRWKNSCGCGIAFKIGEPVKKSF